MSQFICPISFACTLITGTLVLPTTYNINLNIIPEYKTHPDINVGIRKLRSFVDAKLHNSIFISKESEFTKLDLVNNMVVFPTDPYDHVVGCILLRKFLSITERYFDIEFLAIDSLVGDHIQYTIEDPEEGGLDIKGNFWWNTDTLDTGSKNDIGWDDLNIESQLRFEPKIVRGGLSENK
jgi:hypothetical protein